MAKAKRFVLWLSEKLDVNLEEHFKPQTEGELFQFIETDFELTSEEKAEAFLIRFGEDYLDLDLEEHYRPKNAEDLAEDMLEIINDNTVGSPDVDDDRENLEEVFGQVAEELSFDLEEHFDSNPVEQIYELDDEPGKLYLWKLPSEWSEQQRDNLFARLVSSYREKFSRDPKAAHLLLTELDELKDINRDEMKSLLGYAADDL